MMVKPVDNPNIWEKFVQNQKKTSFFQSWWWGEVQKQLGFEVFRLALKKGDEIVAAAQVVKVKAKRGTFFWLRHGPIFSHFSWQQFDYLINFLKKQAKRHNVSFIRISPFLEDNPENWQHFKDRGFRPAPIHNLDAENALVIDLSPAKEELLANMRKNTRYLVRKSLAADIQVEQTVNPQKVTEFVKLYKKTAARQRFVPHRGIKEELAILGAKDMAQLFLAYWHDKLAAGAVVVFYGNEAVYHHAAMDYELRHIPASYRLQWEIITEAKKKGKKYYNLWGIAPREKPHHPWQGLTLFKRGFGGRERRHIHAQDLPLSGRYWFTWFIETVRRIRKGY